MPVIFRVISATLWWVVPAQRGGRGQHVARHMEHMPTRAMHEGEPTADEIAIARVIGDVWLSSLVAWGPGGRRPAT